MGRKKKSSSEKLRRRTQEEMFGIVNQASASAATAPALDAAKVETEFADILKYQRKTANNLLGIFVGEKYKLSKDLISRLIALPKKFDRIENNVLYAATILGEFVLNFKVEMDIQPDFCKAKLFLIEIESDVEEDVKHLTVLDDVTEVYMFEFRNFLCQKWNIFYDDQVIDKGEPIYRYLHLQSEEFLFNRELVEILSQLYVVRMLAILEGLGELGQKAQYEFKLLMEKRLATDPSFAQNFTLQKTLLDYVLRKNNAFAEVLKTEEGLKVLQGYSKPLVNIRDKTYPTILESKKEEKKTQKAASKPAAKAKKKGGADKGPSGGAVDPWKGYKANVVGGVSFTPIKPATPKAIENIQLPKTTPPKAPAQQGGLVAEEDLLKDISLLREITLGDQMEDDARQVEKAVEFFQEKEDAENVKRFVSDATSKEDASKANYKVEIDQAKDDAANVKATERYRNA